MLNQHVQLVTSKHDGNHPLTGEIVGRELHLHWRGSDVVCRAGRCGRHGLCHARKAALASAERPGRQRLGKGSAHGLEQLELVFNPTSTTRPCARWRNAMVDNGMRDAGYVYINVDDTWQGVRDANGVLQPNHKFPDMKALADYVSCERPEVSGSTLRLVRARARNIQRVSALSRRMRTPTHPGVSIT